MSRIIKSNFEAKINPKLKRQVSQSTTRKKDLSHGKCRTKPSLLEDFLFSDEKLFTESSDQNWKVSWKHEMNQVKIWSGPNWNNQFKSLCKGQQFESWVWIIIRFYFLNNFTKFYNFFYKILMYICTKSYMSIYVPHFKLLPSIVWISLLFTLLWRGVHTVSF